MPPIKSKEWDNGIRVAVLTLWDVGGSTAQEICEKYGMARRTFVAIRNKALARGWAPGQPVLIAHVENSPRSGRPRKERNGPVEGVGSQPSSPQGA
ncbi:hypothetical protein CORC01_06766 [Colletotrichum orchidophilum]|uniref:Uncharacterized protein n=1 Tax=Colletotrichum orchidophilum TaxID=1209926 RepID=A0A1G4B967_9PEZI|nr:uncharacterized protein CORC01_06766 [Colletotrichum orchidophilum]OHE97903.1 hypothetical protein CORC01_06766 [Colletotrichum orchidophilum]